MGQNAEVMPRPLNLSIVIHSLEALKPEATLFVSPPPPSVQEEAQHRRARTQTVGQPDEVYPRISNIEIYQVLRGVPSIPILVIPRGYHQLPRYREISAQTLFGQSQTRIQTEESGPKRWD